MSKKKMYWLLAFIITTFALLGVVVTLEFNRYSPWKGQSNNGEQNTGDFVDTADGNQSGESDNASADEETSDSQPGTKTADTEDAMPWEDIVLLFSGDINMTEVIQSNYKQSGIDGILANNFREEFINADIAMVNQEFAFTTGGTKARDKQYTFRVNPDYVQIFKDMQIDVVTLANNHTMDFGTVGLTDTFDTLKSAGIPYVGAGNNITEAREIKYFEVKDKKIACLGASRVIPETDWNAYSNKPGMLTTYDPAMLVEDIKTAKSQSDFVVVYVHWGVEKQNSPKEYQRGLAKQYIDAGADLVVGSHPHVLQGIEYYNGKPIIYSLGNFMFYSNISQTALLKATINEQNEVKLQLIPGKAENAFTYPLEETEDIQKFYDYMTDISFGIGFDSNGNVIMQ
jgi:poly-gamma-glutamate synthesis protein (capsule biosynthesis protein)